MSGPNQESSTIGGDGEIRGREVRSPVQKLSEEIYYPIFKEINDHLEERNPILGILGVPGAGKTTLAKNFEEYLEEEGRHSVTISGDWFINDGRGIFGVIQRLRYLLNQVLFNIPFLLKKGRGYYWKNFVTTKGIKDFFEKVEDFRESNKEFINIEVKTLYGVKSTVLTHESVIIVEGSAADILIEGTKNKKILFVQPYLNDARKQLISRDSGEGWVSKIEWILKSFLLINRGRYRSYFINLYDYDFILDVRNKNQPVLKVKEELNDFVSGDTTSHSTQATSASPAAEQNPKTAITGSAVLDDIKGGIDFNPNNLNLQTQGQDIDYSAPIDPQLLEELMRDPIDGFTPVIFNITPILNLPQLLGLNEERENVPIKQSSLSKEILWREEELKN